MKIYIKPTVITVMLDNQVLLADSNLENLPGGNGSDALSKGYKSIFDDNNYDEE